MATNQPPWPREWLMTDERIGERLWQAIDALPSRAGIVLRHYATPPDDRVRLAATVAGICRDRGLTLAIARDAALAEQVGAGLVHKPDAPSSLACSMSVHDEAEAIDARANGAALVFVAPVHPTRSHPDGLVLGAERAVELAAVAGCPAIALGGMNAERFAKLEAAFPDCFHGYAGIDCWLSDQVIRI